MSINQMVQFPISVQFEMVGWRAILPLRSLKLIWRTSTLMSIKDVFVYDKCGRPVRLKLRLLTLTQLVSLSERVVMIAAACPPQLAGWWVK